MERVLYLASWQCLNPRKLLFLRISDIDQLQKAGGNIRTCGRANGTVSELKSCITAVLSLILGWWDDEGRRCE
jgi:hypothetical protein